MEDYKSNSHKAKAKQAEKERKKVEPVVKSNVIKKKNNVRKLTDTFAPGDISNVKSYIFMDVLVPAIKKAISDIIVNGVDMILYNGESGRNKKTGSASYISYNRYSSGDRHVAGGSRTRFGYDYDDVVIPTRAEAEDVLNAMDGMLDTYGVVSVADLYDLVGVSCNYTDNKYGWMSLRTAEVVRVRDGYIIKLPKAQPID